MTVFQLNQLTDDLSSASQSILSSEESVPELSPASGLTRYPAPTGAFSSTTIVFGSSIGRGGTSNFFLSLFLLSRLDNRAE